MKLFNTNITVAPDKNSDKAFIGISKARKDTFSPYSSCR